MKIIIFISITLLSSIAFSKDYYKKNMVDIAHESLSKDILNLSNSIDDFFADSKHEHLTNKSKLKISLDTYFKESQNAYVIPDINYRLMLPRTQMRLQLFIEKEDDDDEDETSQAKTNRRENQVEETDLSAGLRYMVKKSGIRFSWDNGILVNVPMVFFSRFVAKKKIPFDEWVLKVKQEVKWVNSKGVTSDLDLDYDKKLSRKHVLRMVNNTFWNDQDYIIRFENGPSLFHQINKKMALSYHAHVVSLNKPNFAVDNYILQVTYRQLIYGKWLYMNVSPFTNFPRITNFHRVPGITVGFQAIIGHL
jgi:hypothetical protein